MGFNLQVHCPAPCGEFVRCGGVVPWRLPPISASFQRKLESRATHRLDSSFRWSDGDAYLFCHPRACPEDPCQSPLLDPQNVSFPPWILCFPLAPPRERLLTRWRFCWAHNLGLPQRVGMMRHPTERLRGELCSRMRRRPRAAVDCRELNKGNTGHSMLHRLSILLALDRAARLKTSATLPLSRGLDMGRTVFLRRLRAVLHVKTNPLR